MEISNIAGASQMGQMSISAMKMEKAKDDQIAAIIEEQAKQQEQQIQQDKNKEYSFSVKA